MKQPRTVALGYEVGTGTPVAIPIGHMCVTGQTQMAGKTTALEALVERSGLRAVTFITKRGEGSFSGGRRIPPFFRERADWVFVASLIDATLGEKNKFLRSFLMKVCRNTSTLAEVHRNVKAAQASAKRGFDESIYTEIDGYLDLVVPQLAQLPPPRPIVIGPGLNVVDLSDYSTELQALVIKSFLEHIYDNENEVVTVIPEAWEFLPEGRGSPVKREAETLIRKGAVLRNFVWLDSQDLAGVWKLAVRACPVYLIGVQRESNEIKRTLDNIHGVSKPKKDDVAQLELGQFFACYGKHAIKTYVQPAWVSAANAQKVARGEVSADLVRRSLEPMPLQRLTKEDPVTKDEAARLTRENEMLLRQNAELRLRVEALEKGRHDVSGRAQSVDRSRDPERGAGDRDRDGADAARAGSPSSEARAGSPISSGGAGGINGHVVDETLYKAIRARILEDEPILLKALTTHPEIVVEVTPKVVTVEGDSMKGRVTRLMAKGWFDQARETGDVRKELARTGTDPGGGGTLGIMLNRFVADGFFVREGGGFVLAPGVKVSEKELRVS